MRYLVETEDSLVIKNITLNNECKITTLGEREADYTIDEELNLYKVTCHGCGGKDLRDKISKYCPDCGAKRRHGYEHRS